MTIRRMIFASVATFALSMLAGAANAVTITIGLQQGAGPISTVNSCVNTGAVCSYNDGATSVSATGSPPNSSSNLLGTTALNFSASGSGTLTVYVTASNISAPLGNLSFTSAFTSTLLPAGWSVTETTLLSTSNQIFDGGITLSTNTFNSIGSLTDSSSANPGSGPYSVTAVYSIATNGVEGTGLSTIAISAVPGPIVGAGLPGLIIACGGLLALARRRRKVAL